MNFKNITIHYKDKIYTRKDYEAYTERYKGTFKSGDKVLICLDRSPELIFAIVMAIEWNITFIPVGFDYPQERIQAIADLTDADKIICDRDFKIQLHPEGQNGDSNIAYILFTSGSTGVPKGIEIPRSALVNFSDGMAKKISFIAGHKILCLSSVTFDIFLLESLVALHYGLEVVLVPENVRKNAKTLVDFILQHKPDYIQMTPSRLQMLENYDTELGFLSSVKYILVGGENFPVPLFEKVKKTAKGRIYNLYGPTEATIWATVADLTNREDIIIGEALDNMEVILLDDDCHCLEKKGIGEICISGAGLGKGYCKMDIQTNASFINLPECSGKRFYRTGDLGEILKDGQIRYIGRIDNQVKIHGYRVEPEEIEAVLNTYPGVHRSIVTVKEGAAESKILEAYYKSESDISLDDAKAFLELKLPPYMVPASFVRVKEFKYTNNNKIDRKRISECERIILESEKRTLDKPEHEILERIGEYLDIEAADIDVSAGLPSVGVDSIAYIKLIVYLEEHYDIEVDEDLLVIDAFQSISELIKYIKRLLQN